MNGVVVERDGSPPEEGGEAFFVFLSVCKIDTLSVQIAINIGFM